VLSNENVNAREAPANGAGTRPAPLIGVTGWRVPAASIGELAALGLDGEADVLLTPYAVAIERAGGLAVHLPRSSAPQRVLERLDGLLLAGGHDVDPSIYGAHPTPAVRGVDRDRDDYEIALARAAFAAGVPVLGICRGCQLLNVARGGTLVPDLPGGLLEVHQGAVPIDARAHEVLFAKATLGRRLYGDVVRVNSYHHQAVERLGDGLEATGRSGDGLIEFIEARDVPAIGMQWHPEYLPEPDPIFGWLIEASRASCAAPTTALTRDNARG
jgi:putative glutamine amidotransferase